MNSSTNVAASFSASSSVSSPADLSDPELSAATRRLLGRSNQLLAALLSHLGEVEARGIHRTRACASLYAYCIYELRFSEDEAFRRVSAARFVRRFPALLDAVAAGELHLTGLLMIGPHLTDENLSSVLVRAKHRPPCGARSSSATRGAARSAMFPGSAAVKPTASSCTT